jgi:aerobic-type carbon monoxide dehydrogenase small subunit (CoxS/CutS family)
VTFTLNGASVTVAESTGSLLAALRGQLGMTSVKDGCSPQGQCGCCTVWIDGQPRVSCVTPVARVRGRNVTTIEGLATADAWSQRFDDEAAQQCGFCTPGIIMRIAAHTALPGTGDPAAVRRALATHTCRCTGWQPIIDAACRAVAPSPRSEHAARRALLEGGVPQRCGADIARGDAGCSVDTAPADALFAVLGADNRWSVGATQAAAVAATKRPPARRSGAALRWPVELPAADFDVTLQTTWVDPATTEPDTSWCEPHAEPSSVFGNGGSFGSKHDSLTPEAARRLSREYGVPVVATLLRDDMVRQVPKRPPLAIAVNLDGRGALSVRRCGQSGDAAHVATVAAQWCGLTLDVREVTPLGPPTSLQVRAAVWAELLVVAGALAERRGAADWRTVRTPDGASATVEFDSDGSLNIVVDVGEALDSATLRSYVCGAAHMALGWVRTEAIAVDDDGQPTDVTLRSVGMLTASDTPEMRVEIVGSSRPPVAASTAVFAATALAAWHQDGWSSRWPTMRT